MTLRNLPDDFSPQALSGIDARLNSIRSQHDVAIPLAVESGSRAWGFASPDSDYDCRFVFVRPVEQHLTPWPRRDVIEMPIEDDLDVNGWELGKAVKLLLKGNAVIIEWLRSPIVYSGEAWFRDAFLNFAVRFADRNLIGRHYLHLGERQQRESLGDEKNVPQKKMFYALRPAAALRWLRLNPRQTLPPMHFPTLMSQCDPPSDVAALVKDLIAAKRRSAELGVTSLPAPIAAFLAQEFDAARSAFEMTAPVAVRDDIRARAEEFYRDITVRCAGSA